MEQDKLQKFKQAVFSDVDQKVAEITKQVEDLRKTSLEETEDQQLYTAYNTIQGNVQKIRNDFKLRVSKIGLTAHQDVLRQRENYKQQIFSNVAARLMQYRETEDYRHFMYSCLERLKQEYHFKECTIVTSQNDLWFQEALATDNTVLYHFETDPKIKIGGFYVRNDAEGYLLDETLDSKLKDQNDYFNQYCKLTLE